MPSLEEKCRALEAKIRILEEENELLAERSEEVLLLGLVAENISSLEESNDIIAYVLERISVLKDVPYCACCTIEKNSVQVIDTYAKFRADALTGDQIVLSPAIIEELDQGTYVISGGKGEEQGLSITLQGADFTPYTVAVIPFVTRSIPKGVFVLADDDRTGDRLSPMIFVLQRIVEMTAAKLDSLSLVLELKQLNIELDRKVEERTRELRQANEKLRQEIGERMQAQERLRRERDLVSRITKTSPVGITVVNRKGQITFANARAEQVLGLTRDEVTRRTYNAPEWRITDYDGNPFPDDKLPFRRVMRTGQSVFDIRHAIEWPDGQRVLLSINAAPLFDEAGQVDGMVATVEDVTDQVRAEEALRESEERFRSTFEQAAVGIAHVAPDGRFLRINQRFCDIVGYSQEEMLARTFQDITHPDDLDVDLEYVKQVLEDTIKTYSMEKRYFRKDGSVVWVNLTVSLVREPSGAPKYFISVVEDISQRKRAEEALRESGAKFRNIIESIPMGMHMYQLEQDGRLIFIGANPAANKILGIDNDQFIGQTIEEAFPALIETEVPESYRLAASEGKVWQTDQIIYEENQIKGAFEVHAFQTSPGRMVATFLDITRRRQTEEELRKYREHLEELVEERTAKLQKEITERRRAEEALSEERNLLRILIDNLLDNIFVKDTDGRFLVSNMSHVHFLGATTPGEIIGNTVFDFFPQELAEQYHADDQEIIRSGQPLINREELGINWKTGNPLWFLTTKIPFRDSQRNIVGIVGIAHDITERKRVEEALQQAKEAAEAANRAKSQFLANMSHELRTPLNAILGFSQLMERDPAITTAQRENLGIINRSGEHLLALINDVLDMSKIEAGQTTLNLQSFDLFRTLTSIEEMVRVRAERKGLQFTVHRAPDVPQYLRSDERKLREVLINLLSNAIKFTEEGKVSLRVCEFNELSTQPTQPTQPTQKLKNSKTHKTLRSQKLKNSKTHKTLRFEIEDTGIGIAPDEVDTLFDPFVQSQHRQAASEGTGLGLAISRKFVQLLGGDMTVESEVGQGSVFTFEIQVELAERAKIEAETSLRRVIGLEPNQPTYRILVVEDNLENRMFLTQLLRLMGFEVREATNGQEAIEQHEHWQPHLILMDMRMPVMGGFEATQQIKARAKGQAPPIIALTASAFEEDRARMLAAGCDGFVRKPIREADIFNVMHKHLGVRYVYDEGEGQKARNRGQSTKDALTPAALAALPPDLPVNLQQAIAQLDEEMIHLAIEAIRTHNAPLADALAVLADDFEYEKILTLIREIGEHQ